MFSLNRVLLIKFIPFLVFGILLSCNREKKELVFHYSDGTVIHDSTQLRFLMRELPVQVAEYDSLVSLDVETRLDRQIEQKIADYSRSHSMKKINGMIVMDNQTGDVLYCANSSELNVYSQRLQLMKMYGILLSFEKGVKLTDHFSWIGKYSRKKYDSTVSRLYRIAPPSLEYQYPYDRYSCSQWSAFLQKLDVSENERDCADGEIFPRYYFRTSLFDLVKTGSLISQNGHVHAHNLFGEVKTTSGEVLHVAPYLKGKILKTETCTNTKKVLKRDPFDLIEFSYPIFFFSQGEMHKGMILSTKKYTIGFIATSKSGINDFVTKEIYSLASLLEGERH